MDILKGLRRSCIYALPPYRLGLCGPKKKEETINSIINFIKHPDSNQKEMIKDILSHFGFCKYYQMIADNSGISDIFDERIVEAYWLGSELLDYFFSNKVEEIPFHNFIVLTREEPEISGKMKNICCVSWGQIKDLISNNKIKAEYHPIGSKICSKTFCYDSSIKIGNIFSVHWETLIEIINEKKAEQLNYYTQKTFNLLAQTCVVD